MNKYSLMQPFLLILLLGSFFRMSSQNTSFVFNGFESKSVDDYEAEHEKELLFNQIKEHIDDINQVEKFLRNQEWKSYSNKEWISRDESIVLKINNGEIEAIFLYMNRSAYEHIFSKKSNNTNRFPSLVKLLNRLSKDKIRWVNTSLNTTQIDPLPERTGNYDVDLGIFLEEINKLLTENPKLKCSFESYLQYEDSKELISLKKKLLFREKFILHLHSKLD